MGVFGPESEVEKSVFPRFLRLCLLTSKFSSGDSRECEGGVGGKSCATSWRNSGATMRGLRESGLCSAAKVPFVITGVGLLGLQEYSVGTISTLGCGRTLRAFKDGTLMTTPSAEDSLNPLTSMLT